jgi:hypothetical protein
MFFLNNGLSGLPEEKDPSVLLSKKVLINFFVELKKRKDPLLCDL